MSKPTDDREPRALSTLEPFEKWDFEALAPERQRSPEYNERRLQARRKLGGLAKTLVKRAKVAELALDSRTSLHNPHAFNQMRVKRLWAYICRAKSEKTRLRKVVGRDLAKDLDSAYRNAYLCVALEHDALEVSLRIHADAWFDGQNLKKRVAGEGVHPWLAELNKLPGYQLRLHDWKGEWPCGTLPPERVEEFMRFYTPGEHSMAVERRWPMPSGARDAAFGADVPGMLVDELERLLPLYRFTAWSQESDHLFS